MSKIQKCKNQTQDMSWGPLFSSNHAGHAHSCTHLLKGANTCDCCFTSRSSTSVFLSCFQGMMGHRLILRAAARKADSRLAACPARPWSWRLSGDSWSSSQCRRLGLEPRKSSKLLTRIFTVPFSWHGFRQTGTLCFSQSIILAI